MRPGSDMDKERGGRNRLAAPGGSIVEDEAFEAAVPTTADDPGIQSDADVRRCRDLLHEIVGHTLGE